MLANRQAYKADREAAKQCLHSYIPAHNLDMLLFAAGMAGEYAGDCRPGTNREAQGREPPRTPGWEGGGENMGSPCPCALGSDLGQLGERWSS